MPRDLKPSERNELILKDGRSGDDITFYYRNPEPSEEVSYQGGLFVKKGKKVKGNISGTRLKFGLLIITGFCDKSFEWDGEPISSDPNNKEHYKPEWRDWLEKYASDLVRALAFQVFEGTSVTTNSKEDFFIPEFEEGEKEKEPSPVEEKEVPLESSSDG